CEEPPISSVHNQFNRFSYITEESITHDCIKLLLKANWR
ncbi:unnamed protein product, partial [Chrysoparadoxa australica]